MNTKWAQMAKKFVFAKQNRHAEKEATVAECRAIKKSVRWHLNYELLLDIEDAQCRGACPHPQNVWHCRLRQRPLKLGGEPPNARYRTSNIQ